MHLQCYSERNEYKLEKFVGADLGAKIWRNKLDGDVQINIQQKSPVYYHMLNQKMIPGIVATNRMLYDMGLRKSAVFERCKPCIDTLEHKVQYCEDGKHFGKLQQDDGLEVLLNNVKFTFRKIVLDIPEDSAIDRIITMEKMVMKRCASACIETFIHVLKTDISNEKFVA